MDRNIFDFRNFGSIYLGKSIRMEKVKLLSPSHASQTVAGQLTRPEIKSVPESTRPWVN